MPKPIASSSIEQFRFRPEPEAPADRAGDKLSDYQTMPALDHLVHVAHDERRVDVWTRSAGTWTKLSYASGEIAVLGGVGCRLDVSAVFADPLG